MVLCELSKDFLREKAAGDYLLRRNVEATRPEINFSVALNAREDEEDASRSSRLKTTQPKNHSSLVFLHHLLHHTHGP